MANGVFTTERREEEKQLRQDVLGTAEVYAVNIAIFNKYSQQRQEANLTKQQQKENESKFETAIAVLFLMREALVMRTATLRAYSFHSEQYEEPETIERDESVFAIISLFYLFSAALSAYLYSKDLPTPLKNRLLYDVIDTVTWSVISIMRFPGTVFSDLDASEWEGMSTSMLDGFVVGCYSIELINQLRFDIAQYQYYKTLLDNDPTHPDYQYEIAKCQLGIGFDVFHLTSMIVGVTLKMASVTAGGTPVGLILMVVATAGNQLKNVGVAIADLYTAIEKCERKIKPLTEKLAALNTELADRKHPPTKEKIIVIHSEISQLTQEIQKTKQENMKDIRKAQKKFVFEIMRLTVLLLSLGLLAMGGPLGAMTFAIGVVGFLLIKSTFLLYEKYEAHQEQKSALVSPGYNATITSTTAATTSTDKPIAPSITQQTQQTQHKR